MSVTWDFKFRGIATKPLSLGDLVAFEEFGKQTVPLKDVLVRINRITGDENISDTWDLSDLMEFIDEAGNYLMSFTKKKAEARKAEKAKAST